MSKDLFPQPVAACLWSYDLDLMDIRRDKEVIIFQVLNYGTEEAAKWLFATYSRLEILDVFKDSIASAWFKKSLTFWKEMFGVSPRRQTRLV